MAVINVTLENFPDIRDSGKTVLLDFYALWCGPCREMMPVIERIARDEPDIIVGRVDVDQQSVLAHLFGVSEVPMFAVLCDGEVKRRASGVMTRGELLELLDDDDE